MGEAGGGGVRGGETAEKLACIAMEFSWPAGRELRVGWRGTDHPPLSERQTDGHTPQPVSGGGGNGSGRGISDPETVFAKIKGQEDRSDVPSPLPGEFLSKPCRHPGATAGSAIKLRRRGCFSKARPARNSTTQSN